MLDDFIALLYPRVCMACGNSLFKHEQCICTFCCYHLPKTNFHRWPSNPVAQMFWGRIPLYSAASYYYFAKQGKVQHLLHQLKYKGQKDIGTAIGKLYGTELMESELFSKIQCILPVPLHAKKLKKRGYNQSETFAQGLAQSMGADCPAGIVQRMVASETQTKKSRFKRWENVESIFTICNGSEIENKHVLLVDDVITTGATIEACAQALSKVPGVKVSVASIAYAPL